MKMQQLFRQRTVVFVVLGVLGLSFVFFWSGAHHVMLDRLLCGDKRYLEFEGCVHRMPSEQFYVGGLHPEDVKKNERCRELGGKIVRGSSSCTGYEGAELCTDDLVTYCIVPIGKTLTF